MATADTAAGANPGEQVLLTGATGFVGAELLPSLAESAQVRCLVRDSSKLPDSPGYTKVEADLGDIETLKPALEGIETVFYLVHSMEPGSGNFADNDREAAENFAEVAAGRSVRRIIYLGGVSPSGEDGDEDSEHLESRNEVESILGDGIDEFVALKASMVVGAKSDSFLTLVQLVERLPVLALPSWRDRKSQPVAIDDVVEALNAARSVPPGSYDIAGPDTLTFEEITEVVAELLGKEHRSIPLPFSSAALESRTAAAVVDADIELLKPLMAGLHSDLMVEDNALLPVFGVTPTPFRAAAKTALAAMEDEA